MNLKQSKWIKWAVLAAIPLILFAALWPMVKENKKRANTNALLGELRAQHPSLSKMRYLLDNGANPNGRDEHGDIFLYVAMNSGSDSLKLLLDHGAYPDARSTSLSETVLIRAADNGSIDQVGILLAKGADINIRDKKGATALSKVRYRIKVTHRGRASRWIQIERLLKSAGK